MTVEDFITPDPAVWLVIDGFWIKREWIREELAKAWDEGALAGWKQPNPYRGGK